MVHDPPAQGFLILRESKDMVQRNPENKWDLIPLALHPSTKARGSAGAMVKEEQPATATILDIPKGKIQ